MSARSYLGYIKQKVKIYGGATLPTELTKTRTISNTKYFGNENINTS